MLTSFLTFNGRIGRGMWWLTMLVQTFILVGGSLVLIGFNPDSSPQSQWQGLVFFGVLLVAFWVGICANIKRYHDRGKSGFWVFIGFVPIIGGIWMLIELGMLPGDEGANDFGPAPGTVDAHSENYGRRADDQPSKLSKLDDAYFAEYAKRLAEQSKASSHSGNASVAFGRRKTDVI